MKLRIGTLAAGLALCLAAMGCGGSNPGSGTRTLFLVAEAETDGSTDGSSMGIQVREGHSDGSLVTDAVVTIKGNVTGEFAVPWEGVNWGGFRAGLYLKRRLDWDTGWEITVKRGNDGLTAYLEAPGITTITEPLGGTTYRRTSGEPLVVRWRDEKKRRAGRVSIDFRRADQANKELSEDPQQYLVEPNRLVAASDERVEVRRTNEIHLEGGAAGSRFSATTRHRVEFKVE